MNKTLLVSIDFWPAQGGVANYWKHVCRSFDGADFFVLTTEIAKDQASYEQVGCTVVRDKLFFSWLWPKWLRGVFTIRRHYRKLGCQQILVGQVLPIGSMVYLLHRLFGIRYFVQVYGMDLLMARQRARKEKLCQRILQSAEHIFVNSKAVGRIVEEYGIDQTKYSVVYPIPENPVAVDQKVVERLKEKHGVQDKKIVLSMGRLVARKGFDKALGAMLHVWQQHPQAVYVLLGDGPQRQRLQEMAEPHKDKVIFLGAADDNQRNLWLAACDMLVMPARQTTSDMEGFGIVYLEAHAFAKPVVAGNSGGIGEAVIAGETGLLVDPEDVDVIAQAVIKLLDQPQLAKELGENGRQRLNNELSWENSIHTLKEKLSL